MAEPREPPMVVWHAYLLGTRVADYAREQAGTDEADLRPRHLEIIMQIAQGDLTLIDTPQEILAENPNLTADVKRDLAAILAEGRRYERDIATFLLNFTMQVLNSGKKRLGRAERVRRSDVIFQRTTVSTPPLRRRALPKALFEEGNAALMLLDFSDRAELFFIDIWRATEHQLPLTERTKSEPKLTTYWLGDRVLVLLVHMPEVERDGEAYFLVATFHPTLRYFALSRAPRSSGTILHEVTPAGSTDLGPGPPPESQDLLEHLCEMFGVPPTVHRATVDEILAFAHKLPASGPMDDQIREQIEQVKARPKPVARWWQFWS